MSKPTLDQQRAEHAWEAIQEAKRGNDSKKYGGQAKKLPMRIMAAGLGPALAFLEAKEYAPALQTHLTEWIKTRIPVRQNESGDLLQRIIKGDSNFLRRATDETLAYMQWLNRFAEAEGLTDDEGTGG